MIEPNHLIPTIESPRPSIPPTAASSTDSVSSWPTSRPRAAPRAERTASSRFRAVARVSRRLATFAQAISSTKPTATMQITPASRAVLSTKLSCRVIA